MGASGKSRVIVLGRLSAAYNDSLTIIIRRYTLEDLTAIGTIRSGMFWIVLQTCPE